MKSLSRFWIYTFFLSIGALGFLACTDKSNEDGDLFVFHGVLQDDVKTWDPANAYDVVSLDVTPSVYETLYQYSYLADPFKVEPLLAADMPKFSKDHLTLTIPLKRGVVFQNDPCFKETGGKGREVKAQDFVYAIKRHALPSLQSQGWWVFDGKIAGINAFHDKLANAPKTEISKTFEEDISGVRAIDDYTLQLKLTKPYPQLMNVLAMTFTAPVAHEAIKAYGDEGGNLTDHPVGTGPYVLKLWDHNRRVVLERNPTHHKEFYPTDGHMEFRKKGFLEDAGKQLPFLDRLVFDVIKEQQPRWLNFMAAKLDNIILPKDNFAAAITNQVNLSPELSAKGIRLNIETGTTFYYVSFNMKDKVIGSNKFLRQALSSAIDRDKWIEIFTNGTGKKMVNALPPGTPDRPTHSQIKYDFNLAQAKELLKKAGFPDGKGLPQLNFDLRGADSVSRQLGEFFSRQWAAIGVKINVISNTFPAYLEKAKQGNLQISYGGWGMDYPDAENSYQLLYGPNKAPGPNESNFDRHDTNRLYEQIAVLESGPWRANLIQKMDDIIQEECPWAMGYYFAEYDLTQPWLLNFRVSNIITNRYKYLRLNRDIKKRYKDVAAGR